MKIAVGGRAFGARTEAELGARAHYRPIEALDDGFVLPDPAAAYAAHFTHENVAARSNRG